MSKKSMGAATAEVILEVLVREIGLEPEQDVPDQFLKTKILERGRHYDEIAAGLYSATDQGWLRYEHRTDSFFLTQQSGFNWVKVG